MRAWGFVAGHGKSLDEEAVRQTLTHVGYSHILLDPVSRSVRFACAQVEMDPGGIGKTRLALQLAEDLVEAELELVETADDELAALIYTAGQPSMVGAGQGHVGL
jgi:thiamine biosynthesis lipoprotein ApbE